MTTTTAKTTPVRRCALYAVAVLVVALLVATTFAQARGYAHPRKTDNAINASRYRVLESPSNPDPVPSTANNATVDGADRGDGRPAPGHSPHDDHHREGHHRRCDKNHSEAILLKRLRHSALGEAAESDSAAPPPAPCCPHRHGGRHHKHHRRHGHHPHPHPRPPHNESQESDSGEMPPPPPPCRPCRRDGHGQHAQADRKSPSKRAEFAGRKLTKDAKHNTGVKREERKEYGKAVHPIAYVSMSQLRNRTARV